MASNSLPFSQLEESEFDEDLKGMLYQVLARFVLPRNECCCA